MNEPTWSSIMCTCLQVCMQLHVAGPPRRLATERRGLMGHRVFLYRRQGLQVGFVLGCGWVVRRVHKKREGPGLGLFVATLPMEERSNYHSYFTTTTRFHAPLLPTSRSQFADAPGPYLETYIGYPGWPQCGIWFMGWPPCQKEGWAVDVWPYREGGGWDIAASCSAGPEVAGTWAWGGKTSDLSPPLLNRL